MCINKELIMLVSTSGYSGVEVATATKRFTVHSIKIVIIIFSIRKTDQIKKLKRYPYNVVQI